jgi:hypothetical protein
VDFELVLKLRDASGAQSLVRAISSPGSASYRHYLTASQWESRFSPATNEVSTARAWLASEGFAVGAVSKDRITISASGTAAQVEKAFGTTLKNYKLHGHTVRMAASTMSVPASLSGSVAGALGINQNIATTASTSGSAASTRTSAAAATNPFPPAPPAFITAPPCGSSYSAKIATVSPPFGHGYPHKAPYPVCGYKPGQLRPPTTSARRTPAGASPWPSSTPTARPPSPAQNFIDGLFNSEQNVIDNGLANVVTNSWGDDAGDLLGDVATRTAYDDLFMMADSTGISVLFSSGDNGDNFNLFGLSSADYPPSSPFVTAVGGTSLKVGAKGRQTGQLGWATGRSWKCTANVVGGVPSAGRRRGGRYSPRERRARTRKRSLASSTVLRIRTADGVTSAHSSSAQNSRACSRLRTRGGTRRSSSSPVDWRTLVSLRSRVMLTSMSSEREFSPTIMPS